MSGYCSLQAEFGSPPRLTARSNRPTDAAAAGFKSNSAKRSRQFGSIALHRASAGTRRPLVAPVTGASSVRRRNPLARAGDGGQHLRHLHQRALHRAQGGSERLGVGLAAAPAQPVNAARSASTGCAGAAARPTPRRSLPLGSMKGPLMKVAQMLTTIPDAVPADFAAELTKLQSQAPPMGARSCAGACRPSSGRTGASVSPISTLKPAAAASLGQVHRAISLSGERLACKLQYPDMASAVETDLSNLDLLFSLHRRASAAIDTREMAREIRERVREELDYAARGQDRTALSRHARRPAVRARAAGRGAACRRGDCSRCNGSTASRWSLSRRAPQEARDAIAVGLFDAWWRPFLRYGVIHGDPHLGNYTVATSRGR